MSSADTVYTIGHSTHTLELFIELLKKHAIDVVVDVRSVPYSQFADQFNKEQLQAGLGENNIYYLHMGDSLGARYEDSILLFPDGKVDFEKVRQTEEFQKGIARVREGSSKGHRIAIMCSEKNPAECHRFAMVSHHLDLEGVQVIHILPDTEYKHKDLENRMFSFFSASGRVETDLGKLAKVKGVQQSMFAARTIDDMYRAINQVIGYDNTDEEGET